jgi:hypothetical protein
MFLSWYRKRAQKTPAVRKGWRPRPSGFRPSLEGLEDRTVPTFLAPVNYATGGTASLMAVGDFNGDGKLDIATANSGTTPTLSVLLGNGDGTFQAGLNSALGGTPGSIYTGAQGHTITTADINGDGRLDLAVVSGQNALVLLGNGDGTFLAPASAYLGPSPARISAADVNGDGFADLLAANTNGTVSVLLSHGDGTFAPAVGYLAANDAQDVRAADLNGDGKLDLVVANAISAGSVNVLLGNGDGTFQPYHAFAAYSAPYELVLGDFNGDGHMDVCVANSYTATIVTELPGNGDGTLGLPHSYSVYTQPWDIETGDFNNDHLLDLMEGNGSAGYNIETGNGDGTFAPVQQVAAASGSRFAVGDFNGDGATDVAGTSSAGGVAVLINTNNGTLTLGGTTQFSVTSAASTIAGTGLSVTVQALAGSGNVATQYAGTVVFSSSDVQAGLPASYAFTAADAGSHTFTVTLKTAGTQSISVKDSESLTVTGSESGIVVSPAAATAFALSNLQISPNGATPAAIVAGTQLFFSATARDAYGNVATGYGGTVTFASSDAQAALAASYTFTSADAGLAWFPVTLKTVGYQSISIHDVGAPAVAGAMYNVSVTPGAASTFSLVGGAGPAGGWRTVTITARDSYGNYAPVYNGTVHLSSSDAAAVLPADTTLVNGTANVSVRMMTVGTQTLTATNTANPALTGSETISVTPAVLASYDVTGFPATVAGAAHNFTVTARNTLGQVMTGYTGTVIFSSSDVQAGLPASYIFSASDKGVHTFTATLKTAGSQTLRVHDSVDSTSTGAQSGIAVTAAAAASVSVTGYSATVAGVAHTFTVTARDAYGNVATGYTGTVKFTSTDAQASLPANYTFTAADAGSHTFTATLKTAAGSQGVGGQTITAQDVASTALVASQTNIQVSNATASVFVLVVPANIVPGTAFSLKVLVQDAYGNKCNDYRGTVHFSNTAGTAGLPADYTFTNADNGQHTFSVTLSSTGAQTISLADIANALLSGSATVNVGGAASGGGGGGGGGGGPHP